MIDAFSKGLESIGLEVMWDNADLILSEYGERMQLSFTIPNYDFNPGDGNPIILKINCLNSVDKSTALEIKLSWYRLVCKNGMIFADDGEVERSNKKVPTHNLTVKSERRVPGQPTPSNNIFNVSQALSWLAGHRTSIQDRLEKTMQIPDLIDNLIKIIN